MKKNIEVLQEEVSDCGICSLASIIKFYGGDVSLELLRYYTNTTQDGTNAYEIINCAKRLGFNAYGEKTDNLIINQPVIAHMKLSNNFFHFVVVYKIKKEHFLIMDPSCGMKKMLKKNFYDMYTGVIIKIFPLNEIPQYQKNNFLLKYLSKEIKCRKKQYIMLLIIGLLTLLITMLSNFEIKILSYNNNYIYILLLFLLFNQSLQFIKTKILLKTSILFNKSIIQYFVLHIFKLPLYYLKLKQKGEISTRFNELNSLTNSILNFIINLLYIILLLLLSIVIIFFISFKIFVFILLFSIVYIIINIKVYNKLINEIKSSINLEENYNSNILDYISNFSTIKHLNTYNYFTSNILNNLSDRNKVSYKINNKIYLINYFNELLLGVILLLVIYVIVISSYTLSNGIVIYILFNFYLNNLKELINNYPSILIYKTYINKCNDFLSIKLNDKKEKIYSFDKIVISSLNYSSINKTILDNINYEIKYKDKIFLCGPSGIGKSTLLKILNNEINRYSGYVLIDGKDIKNLDVSNLITYVAQDETLFNDTLYNNITLGKNVSKEEIGLVIKICRLENIDLNSLIINNNSLCGGERNRLVLARSLIHAKDILILDEVLKEVDKSLEIKIIKDILKFYKDKTIIYISHKNVGNFFHRVLTFGKE